MRYYFAPMEGITDSIFRRVHHRHFGGVDRYYTPFFSPTVHRALTPREARELPMADSVGFETVPQILTKSPEDFLWMAHQCAQRGYKEVNLNLGCPSGTVTAKGKGAGMLADIAGLDAFLDAVFSRSPLPISVKTRIGFAGSGEWPALLAVLNRYPIRELTVHPRVRRQFYDGAPDMAAFRYGWENSQNPLCYNGNIQSPGQAEALGREYPGLGAVMIGRGLLADPGMLTPGGTTAEALAPFMEELLEEYQIHFGGSRNAMFRLKENWSYLIHRFEGSEKLGKRLRKATDLNEYRAVTAQIFATLPLKKL